MTTTLVQFEWGGHGLLENSLPTHNQEQQLKDTHNTIVDAKVTIIIACGRRVDSLVYATHECTRQLYVLDTLS